MFRWAAVELIAAAGTDVVEGVIWAGLALGRENDLSISAFRVSPGGVRALPKGSPISLPAIAPGHPPIAAPAAVVPLLMNAFPA